MEMDRRSALVTAIERAFASRPYPGDDMIAYSNDPHHLSCDQVKSKFSGLHWRRVTAEVLEDTGSFALFMTPEAERFYLPAFLLIATNHPDSHPSLRGDLVDRLSAVDRVDVARRFDGLSRDERDAVAEFLRYVRDTDAETFEGSIDRINHAIDQFWSK